eukprot:scaffold5708_cov107-Isochrysis_galbana.AAC.24
MRGADRRLGGNDVALMRGLPSARTVDKAAGDATGAAVGGTCGCNGQQRRRTFSKKSKFALYLSAKARISAGEPFSCRPNWLQGKARMRRPRSYRRRNVDHQTHLPLILAEGPLLAREQLRGRQLMQRPDGSAGRLLLIEHSALRERLQPKQLLMRRGRA